MSNHDEIKIVMVEDDEGHATLIERNLRRAGINNEIVHLTSGGKAIDYFFNNPVDVTRSPMLILLDLNLPEIDGYEILRRLKSSEHTKKIPVIILTTTDNPKEIDRCYDLGCNIYVTKPVEYEAFAQSMMKLGLLLSIVKVATKE